MPKNIHGICCSFKDATPITAQDIERVAARVKIGQEMEWIEPQTGTCRRYKEHGKVVSKYRRFCVLEAMKGDSRVRRCISWRDITLRERKNANRMRRDCEG